MNKFGLLQQRGASVGVVNLFGRTSEIQIYSPGPHFYRQQRAPGNSFPVLSEKLNIHRGSGCGKPVVILQFRNLLIQLLRGHRTIHYTDKLRLGVIIVIAGGQNLSHHHIQDTVHRCQYQFEFFHINPDSY